MFKAVCSAALAVLLLTPALQAAPAKRGAAKVALKPAAKPKPIFDFLGQNTEAPFNGTPPTGLECSTGDEKTVCRSNYDFPLAGGRFLLVRMEFNAAGKLYNVNGAAQDFNLPNVTSAFLTKYGPPMRTVIRKWQSKAGASFDNTVLIWDFKGGTLELASMGFQRDYLDFTFTSQANMPAGKPATVDF